MFPAAAAPTPLPCVPRQSSRLDHAGDAAQPAVAWLHLHPGVVHLLPSQLLDEHPASFLCPWACGVVHLYDPRQAVVMMMLLMTVMLTVATTTTTIIIMMMLIITTITTATTAIIIIIIIIAFKGAIRDCLLSPHCATNRLHHVRNRVQITCNTSSAYHVLHVVLRATWNEGTAQLLNLTEFKSHLSELYFIGWTTNRRRRGGNRSTRRKPLATSFRKCHNTKARRFKPPATFEPAQQHWWQLVSY